MTNEEAITRLKGLYGNGYTKQEQALDMAIRALKNEQTDGDLISRKKVLKEGAYYSNLPTHTFLKDVVKVLPSAEKTAKGNTAESYGDLITELSKLNTIESSDGQDYVQMYDVLETIKRYSAKEDTAELYWLQYDANPRIGNWHCTKCNMIVSEKNPNYCPNCGAKMKGDTE